MSAQTMMAATDPRAALEYAMRVASVQLSGIEAGIPALYPKAHRTLHKLSDMIATLDEFAESIKAEREVDGA